MKPKFQQECIGRVKDMQAYFMNSGYRDIPFNFLVGDDGFMYEGRGFKYQGELPRKDSPSNFDNLGLIIAFIGTYDNVKPSQGQLATFNEFVERSVGRDVIIRDFKILLADNLLLHKPPAQGLIDAMVVHDEYYECKLQSLLPIT